MTSLKRVPSTAPKSAPKKKERRFRLYFYCTRFHKQRQYGDVRESELVQTFLQDERMDLECQIKETQDKLLELLQIEAPEIYEEEYAGKELDFLVRFSYPNPKWTPEEELKEFGGERQMLFMTCPRSCLLEAIRKYRVDLPRFRTYKRTYEWAVNLQKEEPTYSLWYDPVHLWIEEDLKELDMSVEEFLDHPLAGHTWKKEKKAIKEWNRKHGISETPKWNHEKGILEVPKEEPKLTREELLERDKEFLAQFDEKPKEEKIISPEMLQKQDKLYQLFQTKFSEGVLEDDLLKMPQKIRRGIAKVIDSGNAICAELFAEDALNWLVKQVVKRGDELEFSDSEEIEETPTSDDRNTEVAQSTPNVQEEVAPVVASLPVIKQGQYFDECFANPDDYVPENFFDDIEEEEEKEFDYSSLPDTFLTECVNGTTETNEKDEDQFDYSSLSDTFVAECVNNAPEPEANEDELIADYEYELTSEHGDDCEEDDSEDVFQETITTQEPEKVTTSLEAVTEYEQGSQHNLDVNEEETELNKTNGQPRTILRSAYGGAYFNFNPDLIGYGDQSSFKPAMPEQEPEEAAAMSEAITEHEQVSHHDSDVNEEDVKLEVVAEYEQVLHHDPDVNKDDTTFEIITESSCVEEFVWNRNTIEDDRERLLTIDSTPVENTYKVVSEFEIQSIAIPAILSEPEEANVPSQRCNNNKPIATNAIVPFKRTISETAIGNILLKIPLKSACFERKPAKILLLKTKIPKIPIKLGSFSANHPKIVPKPLRLSYKRLKIPSGTNSLYSSFHQKKGIPRTEYGIKKPEKQLRQFCSNELKYISKEAKFRMLMLC